MGDRVRLLLGLASSSFSDAEVAEAVADATLMVEAYTNRSVADDAQLELCVVKLAVIALNRRNTEGLASTSSAGVAENYIDGFPADVTAILNRKRRCVVL